MKTINIDWLPGSFELRLAGDMHEGTIAMSEHAIDNLVERSLAKKNSFVALGGDQFEAITVDDGRFSVQTTKGLDSRLHKQRDALYERIKGLIGRVLYIMDGNHERNFKNTYNPNEDLAGKHMLNCIYADGVMVKAILPDFRILDWHGAGTINSRAGDALQRATNEMVSLKRKLRLLGGADDCDIVAMHHVHKLIVHPPMSILHLVTDAARGRLVETYTQPAHIDIDKTRGLYRVPEEEKWYVACGSFLRGYIEGASTYVEEAGYPAAEIGCIKLTIKNDRLYKVEKEFLNR